LHLSPSLPLHIDYLAIGHPTVDEATPQGDVIGGTVVYSALQAARLGWRAAIMGAGVEREIAPLLAPFPDEIPVLLQPSMASTRFVNVSEGDHRTQWVKAVAAPVVPPARLPDVRVLHIAPVAAELDLAAVVAAAPGRIHADRAGTAAPPRSGDTAGPRPAAPGPAGGAAGVPGSAALVGLTPQGLLRRWGPDGRVAPVPLDVGFEVARDVDVVVLSEGEAPYAEALTSVVRRHGGLVVVTRGSQGCQVMTAGEPQVVPALPVADDVDRTGAGDVFAAALFVALAEGGRVVSAIRFAMAAASCSIAGIGPTAVADRASVVSHLAAAPPL
jgi:hypothetical protein